MRTELSNGANMEGHLSSQGTTRRASLHELIRGLEPLLMEEKLRQPPEQLVDIFVCVARNEVLLLKTVDPTQAGCQPGELHGVVVLVFTAGIVSLHAEPNTAEVHLHPCQIRENHRQDLDGEVGVFWQITVSNEDLPKVTVDYHPHHVKSWQVHLEFLTGSHDTEVVRGPC